MLANRFDLLVDEECSSQKCNNKVDVDLEVVSSKVKTLGNKMERRLRVATWNFSCLCSERKQKEVGELLVENNNIIDIVAGQESWKRKVLK